jgi:hypothetical protein
MSRKEPYSTDLPDAGSESFLVDETGTMERRRREMVQDGHRKLARVNAREHGHETEQSQSMEQGLMDEGPLQHPYLDQQRFDGVDPHLNANPEYLSPEERRDYENKRREQDMEKQLRLGHMPKMGSAPKPQGPQ